MTPGQRIKEARISAGLSQADLARQLGVSRQAMFQIEEDHRAFAGAETLYGLAKFLNTRMEVLMGLPLLERKDAR